jgi:hypothetical protein
VPLPFLYTPVPLHIGAWAAQPINKFASELSGFPQTDQSVIDGVDLYPGQAQCRVSSSHALWHEESANGFLEITFMADILHKYTQKKT